MIDYESLWNSNYELAKQCYEKNGHINFSSRYITSDGIKLGKWLSHQRVLYKKNRLCKSRILALELLGILWFDNGNCNRMKWNTGYEIAKQYYENHGHLNVPNKYVTLDGFHLQSWITTQISLYKKNSISKEKIDKLNCIGIVWNRNEFNWDNFYQLFVQFTIDNGHSNVPVRFITNNGESLGAWINNQRTLYNKNKLSKNRIRKLNKINMIWDYDDYMHKKYFSVLINIYKENGNINIPYSFCINDLKLGSWLSDMRNKYRNGILAEEDIIKLNKMEIIWDFIVYQWEKSYNHAKNYFQENGHLNVPQNFKTKDGFWLGNWISLQRSAFRKHKLSLEQINKLDSLNITWVVHIAWDESYKLAEQYCKENNTLNIPERYIMSNGYRLGSWLKVQKYYYRKGLLSKEHTNKLLENGFL